MYSNFLQFYDLKKFFFTVKLLIKYEKKKSEKIPRSFSETIMSQIVSWNFFKIGWNPEDQELIK